MTPADASSLSPAELRALIPALAHQCYLNAAASSPLPTPVARAGIEQLEEASQAGDVGWSRWVARKQAVRAVFARHIGASPDEVAFLPSTSMGMHVVGSLLKQLGVTEVVTLSHEFPSTTVPLLHQGLTLRVVAPRPDGRFRLEDVEAALTARTGALVASVVQYQSGFRLPLAQAVALARARGLQLALNGAQALGQLSLDVGALGVDFLCGTSHKWLMGGYGTGLFYARRALFERCRLPFAGWLSVPEPLAMDNLVGAARAPDGPVLSARGVSVRQDASALEAGTHAWAPLFGLGEALTLLERVGMAAVEAHVARLQAHLRAALRARGFVPNAPDEPSLGSGICVFPVAGSPEEALRALGRRAVRVSARGGGLRVSTHVYNTEEDVERLLWALAQEGVRPP